MPSGDFASSAYFLLTAIRQLLRTVSALHQVTEDASFQRLGQLFFAEHPDVAELRNVVEHLDEYLRDIGSRQRSGRTGHGVMPDIRVVEL